MKEEKKEKGCCASACNCSTDKSVHSPLLPEESYITGTIDAPTGKIPQVSTTLSMADKWGNLSVRLNIRRMSYKVVPGLYAVGCPDQNSPVFVSANYKLSFDLLRRELKGKDSWILVLNTNGINVWCAAGKGTFGTKELVERIQASGLKEIVTHRKLIVPQLGAVGVSAHKVKKQSGFQVIFGPVRVSDLPAFLDSGMEATREMRQVHFHLSDRLAVIPVEVVQGFKLLLAIVLFFYVLAGFNVSILAFSWTDGLRPALNLGLAYIAGTILGPLLLPFLPGRSFSIKGAFAGLGLFAIAAIFSLTGSTVFLLTAWLLLYISMASFFTMNFTGASTYTSLSGVKKEMKTAIPAQAITAVIGVVLWLSVHFKLI